MGVIGSSPICSTKMLPSGSIFIYKVFSYPPVHLGDANRGGLSAIAHTLLGVERSISNNWQRCLWDAVAVVQAGLPASFLVPLIGGVEYECGYDIWLTTSQLEVLGVVLGLRGFINSA